MACFSPLVWRAEAQREWGKLVKSTDHILASSHPRFCDTGKLLPDAFPTSLFERWYRLPVVSWPAWVGSLPLLSLLLLSLLPWSACLDIPGKYSLVILWSLTPAPHLYPEACLITPVLGAIRECQLSVVLYNHLYFLFPTGMAQTFKC